MIRKGNCSWRRVRNGSERTRVNMEFLLSVKPGRQGTHPSNDGAPPRPLGGAACDRPLAPLGKTSNVRTWTYAEGHCRAKLTCWLSDRRAQLDRTNGPAVCAHETAYRQERLEGALLPRFREPWRCRTPRRLASKNERARRGRRLFYGTFS